jgi:sulfhydrogenase subunit beta (sulfur reductase)
MKTQKILSGETMDKILSKKSFSQWVKKLQSYRIYAPSRDNDIWIYKAVNNPEEINLDFPTTALAPKAIIFPQREIFLEFRQTSEGTPEIKEVLPEEEPTIVFGVRPCDAKAVTLMDKVFGGDIEDIYYWKRRNQTVLVGLACNTPPSPNCFCLSVEGSPHSKEGLDILMTDLGDKYYTESLSKKGEEILNLGKSLFTQPKAEDKKNKEKLHLDAEKQIKRHIKDLKKIPPKLKGMWGSPFWDEEAMSCLRCGICTYMCPTCHCFDINDELQSSSPLKGKRIRTWDTCQFPDFTMHSSGHNPRPDKASRLRQRIMHKFQYFVENYQNYQCTGCGRCISNCPVGIDIIEVLDKVRDYGS